MIKWYGHDLNLALSGSIKHLIPNGVIAVDIGDSIYCGVLVPTDALAEEILVKKGELYTIVPNNLGGVHIICKNA